MECRRTRAATAILSPTRRRLDSTTRNINQDVTSIIFIPEVVCGVISVRAIVPAVNFGIDAVSVTFDHATGDVHVDVAGFSDLSDADTAGIRRGLVVEFRSVTSRQVGGRINRDVACEIKPGVNPEGSMIRPEFARLVPSPRIIVHLSTLQNLRTFTGDGDAVVASQATG